jgi:hypothetical protein
MRPLLGAFFVGLNRIGSTSRKQEQAPRESLIELARCLLCVLSALCYYFTTSNIPLG